MSLSQTEVKSMLSCSSIDGDIEFFLEFFENFVDETKKRLLNLKDCLDANNDTGVWETAHQIKGSAYLCELRALAEAAKAVEYIYRNNLPNNRLENLQKLEYEINRVANTNITM